MPTTKPRVTLTLEPEIGETITRLAKLQGVSRASVLTEIINEIHDPLRRTLLLIEAAQAAPGQVREGLRDTVEQTQHQLEKQLQQAGFELAELESAMQGAGGRKAEGPAPRARSTGKGKSGSNPRPSNTGVRSTKSTKSGGSR